MTNRPTATLLNNGNNFVPTLHQDTYARISSTSGAYQKGRSIFISGASKGIGKATAVSFAAAGATRIAIGARGDLSSVETAMYAAAEKAGHSKPEILRVSLDVADRSSVEAAAKLVKEKWNTLDILINNAGYLENWVKITDSDPDEWWKSWTVNVRGIYLMSRSFIPLLLAKKDGARTLVNVASQGANFLHPSASGYQTGKLAVLRFTEFTDAEYRDEGLVCFCVHPGNVVTDMTQELAKKVDLFTDSPELAADGTVWWTKSREEWLGGRYLDLRWDVDEVMGKKEEIVKHDILKARIDVGS